MRRTSRRADHADPPAQNEPKDTSRPSAAIIKNILINPNYSNKLDFLPNN